MRRIVSLSALLSISLLFISALPAFAAQEKSIEPVLIRADKLDALLGKAPDSIRAYAWTQGAFRAIPFQVDERMEVSAYKSWTKRVQILTYAFDYGPKAQPDPDPTFDKNDEFLIMAFSADERAPAGLAPQGAEVCEEIEVDMRDGEVKYAYACSMSSSGNRNESSYVTAKTEDEISAAGYEISFPEGNPVNFDRLQTRNSAGGLNPDVVDRMKLKVDVEVGLGIAKYSLSDSDYQHYLRGVKAGPIRIIKEFETVLETWGGVQFRSYNHVYFYPYHVEYDMLARGALNAGKFFNRSHLVMAIDLDNSARGMKFYSEKNLRGELVDGKTDPSELNMDYGPTEWSAVTGNAGTLVVHMGLDLFTQLHKDLYYSDNDAKGDPPEEYTGMVGKFGYIVRDLQKAGFSPFPVRFTVYPTADTYSPEVAERLGKMYDSPLPVKISRHDLFAFAPDAPPIEDTREKQRSVYAESERSLLQSRFILPNFIFDPNLLGSGPGVSYTDIDFLGTGTYFDAGCLFTERGYSSYWVNLSELRFIKGVDSFRISLGYGSFPAEPYYGIGNDTDKDHRTLYWWKRSEVNVTFKKYFGGIYGADFRVGYKEISIQSGIQPVSGEGIPSFEDHYGTYNEVEAQGFRRWGAPVYGRQGGNMNSISVSLYRDMRDAKNLPKFGNYQEVELYLVSSAFGADYDYARVKIDLRAYWHPDFLNPIPYIDDNVNPRRTFLTKFVGDDKNRAFAIRLQAARLFADEIDWYGQDILDVPFYDLTTIGSSSTLKGFTSKRFRDNDMIVGSLEYRWRWWRFEDIALYYDIGMVANDLFEEETWTDVDDRLHSGYGFSYRIHVPPHVIVTFEWGWSVEEQAILHQMNVGF